jgi:hypothetical protein
VVKGDFAMHTREAKPNEFEVAILERLASREPSIKDSLGALHVLSRRLTGAGSFTNFEPEESTAASADMRVGLDVIAKVPGVPNGLGALLFCRDGKPVCLEIFTFGDDRWDGNYDGFSID